MIIGITGSSGAGKSTVCNILKNTYNAKIIDSDKIAKKIIRKRYRIYYRHYKNIWK